MTSGSVSAAAAQLRLFTVTLDLDCICSGSVRSGPLRSSDPYADRANKISDKCDSKSKTTHSVEGKPVKLLHFSFYASRVSSLSAAKLYLLLCLRHLMFNCLVYNTQVGPVTEIIDLI
ncbi:hypothetical protein ATANTOWER_018570 [Ataeniobius toweri]|uniref:Uncharacterized protein n=1 Tax=Ataeniobius toweri TaxID=208326 RepID=A0ABU7AYJ1_9TELE|nr:hypothetical protein [Ataeniobius toweri]